jgi:hypothetical protein
MCCWQQPASHIFFAQSIDTDCLIAGLLAVLQHDLVLGDFQFFGPEIFAARRSLSLPVPVRAA